MSTGAIPETTWAMIERTFNSCFPGKQTIPVREAERCLRMTPGLVFSIGRTFHDIFDELEEQKIISINGDKVTFRRTSCKGGESHRRLDPP